MALARRVAGYDPRADVAMLERAGRIAAEAHATQKRDNGDPYITHPARRRQHPGRLPAGQRDHRDRACCTTSPRTPPSG